MNSLAHGNNTSAVEVTNVSSHGLWLLAHGEEMFLPFDEFPWFRDASIKAVTRVEEPRPGHYYWPELDVDLSREIIESPGRYELKARADEGGESL